MSKYELKDNSAFSGKRNTLTYYNSLGVATTVSRTYAENMIKNSINSLTPLMKNRYKIGDMSIVVNNELPFHIETKGSNPIIDAKQSQFRWLIYKSPLQLYIESFGVVKYTVVEKTFMFKLKSLLTSVYYKIVPKQTLKQRAIKAYNHTRK